MEAEVEELAGGVEAVAGFGVIDLALHDVDEETDYYAAVVGLLADDVGEGCGGFFGLLFCGEHVFYGNGCGGIGSMGGWRRMGVRYRRGARFGVPFCVGRQVTPVIAGSSAPCIFVKVAGQTVRPLVLETET